MKKIFDWMREQMNSTIGVELFGEEYTGIKRVNRIINEAEAKWEAEYVSIGAYKQVAWERDIAIEQLRDLGYEFGEKIREAEVCEWKKVNDTYKNTCGKTTYTHWCSCIRFFKYCPYCGKPIKISEVE